MGCPLDTHPRITEIDAALQAGQPVSEVRQLDPELDHRKLGIHRRFCLKLPPTGLGRPRGAEKAEDIPEGPVDEAALNNDLLKLLHHRVKTNPGDLKTSEIISFVNVQARIRAAAAEKSRDKADPLTEAMAGVTGGLEES